MAWLVDALDALYLPVLVSRKLTIGCEAFDTASGGVVECYGRLQVLEESLCGC